MKNLLKLTCLSTVLALSACGGSSENQTTTDGDTSNLNTKTMEQDLAARSLGSALESDMFDAFDRQSLMPKNLEGHTARRRESGSKEARLLSMNIDGNVISLYFGKISINEDTVIEKISDPIYTTGYEIAEQNNIADPEIKIFIDNIPIEKIMEKQLNLTIDSDVQINQRSRDNSQQRNQFARRSSQIKTIVVNGGHGYTEDRPGSWRFQRSLIPEDGYREDITNAELAMVLTSKLDSNSNYNVLSVREIGGNPGIGVSGIERWKENARQFFKSNNLPKKIWDETGSNSENKDINSRALYANSVNADVLVGLHTNAAGSTARGTRIYVSNGCLNFGFIDESKKLANILNKHLKKEITKLYDSNWKVSGPYSKCHSESSLGKMPSVIVELGFHTNKEDRKALLDDTFREVAMEAVKLGIEEYLKSDSSAVSSSSYFDGAGSLVRPDNTCWGCDKDEARMQPHSIPSTVVFQWTANNECPYMKVGVALKEGSGEIGSNPFDVTVHTKTWNSHLSEESYNTTLPITVDSKSYWNTTAITSRRSLSSKVRIIARCSKNRITKTKEFIDSPLVDLSSNYYWAGNGSLIARDNPPNYAENIEDAGVKQDWAVTFSQNKAMSIFQWQPSDACPKIRIDASYGGGSSYAPVNQVSMKRWYEASWPNTNLCTQLPCTIDAPSKNGYFILKVKTNAGAVESGHIHASCQKY